MAGQLQPLKDLARPAPRPSAAAVPLPREKPPQPTDALTIQTPSGLVHPTADLRRNDVRCADPSLTAMITREKFDCLAPTSMKNSWHCTLATWPRRHEQTVKWSGREVPIAPMQSPAFHFDADQYDTELTRALTNRQRPS
jgi:hypothetical protein